MPPYGPGPLLGQLSFVLYGGEHCPGCCGSSVAILSPVSIGDDQEDAWRRMGCSSCGAHWTETWRICPWYDPGGESEHQAVRQLTGYTLYTPGTA